MKIAIIVAMSKELNLLLPLIDEINETTINGYGLYKGKIGNHDVCAMQCGIGKVNAAIGTMTLIEEFHPELVINTGVAGGADIAVRQMDVVVGERVAYHDVWCGPGTEYGEAANCPVYFTPDYQLLSSLRESEIDNLKFGLICTGDKFISTQSEIAFIKEKFPDAIAVDMESGAICQVCHLKSTSTIIIRVISDTPGANEDNVSQYDNFWVEAPRHTFAILKSLLEIIK